MPRRDSIADIAFDDLMGKLRTLPWWAGLIFVAFTWLVVCFALPAAFDLFAGDPPPDAPRDAQIRKTLLGTIAILLRSFRWLVLVLLIAMWAVALAKSFTDGKRLDSQQSIETIRALPWREFELLLAEHFRRLGYHVETTPDGPDGGIDLILQRDGRLTLVQAKQWRSERIGVAKVRELFGIQSARRAAESILVTSGRFTPDARAFAEESGVRLIDGDSLEPLILGVRNTVPARRVTSSHDAQASAPPTLQAVAPPDSPPLCPTCGAPMATRTARKGPHAGSRFWGCTKYPACTGKRHIG